ncbi:diadenylate cyclase CdaA [Reichenbachiella sp. MALMAid0571]|uniref:diadenylate cyclase CdaA n=1 Tax=Reichenbachiella sp. MALMAid0571 TaxID=3143939 RepID=UPI0032DE3B30
MILGFQIGFLEISWVDLIDIGMVSILLYQIYKLMKGSVAIKIFLGFLFLYLLFLVVKAANMELLSSILGQFMGVGVIAVIVLFQQEIRKFLLLLGKTTLFDEGNIIKSLKQLWRDKYDNEHLNVTPVIEAIKSMGGSNTGALIVFSRNSELKFYANSGDRLDALVSKRLLLSIFNRHSPLHDGAVIINNNNIIAARCILPVSEQDNLPAIYGLRHRAALGMSEATDSLTIIVSEETGQLSCARAGFMEFNLSTQEVRNRINEYLYNKETEQDKDTKNKDASVLEKLKSKNKAAEDKIKVAT